MARSRSSGLASAVSAIAGCGVHPFRTHGPANQRSHLFGHGEVGHEYVGRCSASARGLRRLSGRRDAPHREHVRTMSQMSGSSSTIVMLRPASTGSVSRSLPAAASRSSAWLRRAVVESEANAKGRARCSPALLPHPPEASRWPRSGRAGTPWRRTENVFRLLEGSEDAREDVGRYDAGVAAAISAQFSRRCAATSTRPRQA